MKSIELQDRGHGLTDYFNGTSGVFLPISVDCKTTVKQVIDEMEREINAIFDHFQYTFEDIPQDILSKQLDDIIELCRERNKDNLEEIAIPDLDYNFDDIELEDENFVCIWLVFEYTE